MNATSPQDGIQLTFYCHQRSTHGGQAVSDWLLERSQALGIGGGSVFRAVAGYGRHGVLHEAQFFDLADDLAVRVEFLLPPQLADRLLDEVRSAGAELVFATTPVRYGTIGRDPDR